MGLTIDRPSPVAPRTSVQNPKSKKHSTHNTQHFLLLHLIVLSPCSATMSSSLPASTAPLEGAKALQERLNQLLSKLSSSIEIVKTWPSMDGDDAAIHVKTTSKLIAAVREIVKALERVEGTLKADAELRKALQNCPIPINLLDLLDHGNGLNPDCFSRGLLRESMGQLAGLKRRKLALEMLGAAVQAGLGNRISESNTVAPETSKKRQRSSTEEESPDDANATQEDGAVAKKTKVEAA